MLKCGQPGTGTDGSTALPEAPFVEGGASFILSPDKLDIEVKVITADSTPVTVEGCEETTLTSGTETVLHAKGRLVILKGHITELRCLRNQLTALNVQGCTALQELNCGYNQLTTLNMQGLTALQRLHCYNNQLTALNVQGCTALKGLSCGYNQLTTLNVQGCTALETLNCYNNKLTAQAFTKLFDDLPTRTAGDGARCILYTEKPGVTEGNCTDFTTPAELQAAFQNAKDVEHWKMHKLNTSGDEEEI